MKRLLLYAKQYRLQAVLAPLFKLAEAVLELLIPLLVADIIDVGIPSSDWRYILGRVGLMVGLAAVGLAFSLTAQYLAARTAVGMSRAIKQRLFAHVQSLSFAELDQLGSANLINRFNSDCQQVQNGVNMFLRLFLRSPFIVFGAMIAAFTVDSSAWIFAVLIPVLSVAVVGITLGCVPLYRLAQGHLDAVTEAVHENLTGMRVVRAYAAENQEMRRFDTLHRNLTAMQRKAGRLAVLLNPITYAVVNGGVIALLWLGAVRVDSGAMSQGEVVAMYNYMTQILVELIKLADLIILLTKSTACGRRIADTLDVHSSQSFAQTPVTPLDTPFAVQFCGVSMRYHEDAADAVNQIDLAVPRGRSLGIIGATGSGKSTLISLLPRFYDATQGQVLLDGVDVTAYPREQLRRKVAVVQQQSVLFDGTLRDNLLFGNPDATHEQLAKALRVAQAEDVVVAKGGLDAEIREGGRNLSGGQRQRLCIARALVTQPDVLVLDDSSSALDNLTDSRLRHELRQLGVTTIVVSQRASAVKDADAIAVLDEGKLIAYGTHAQLMQSCDIYREIALLQQGGSV